MKQRIAYIDIMKGIAILTVLAGHYCPIPFAGVIIWSFHMPLFVFLSGYFFNPDKQGLITKAAKAYLKPYLIVWGLLIICECVQSGIFHTGVCDTFIRRCVSGIWALASNSTLNRPEWIVKIGVIWFLNALFVSFCYAKIFFKIHHIVGRVAFVMVLLSLFMFLTKYTCVPLGLNYGAAFLVWLVVGYYFRQSFAGHSRATTFLISRGGGIFHCSYGCLSYSSRA